LDNTDISTSSKGKAPTSTNGVKAYNKKVLDDKIRRLITANVQLIANKTEIEKVKVNLEADKVRLLSEKNFLVAKRKELRTEIVILNITGLFNVSIYSY